MRGVYQDLAVKHMQPTPRVTLTLGPVLFNWPAAMWRDFYFRIADEAPVEHVCIGEVVCSKREPFFAEVLPDVVERLERGGKAVLMSSLALPTLEREVEAGASLSEGDRIVEANDVSVLRQLARVRHAIGPLVNVYNEGTAAFLARQGAVRIALPPELPIESIATIAAAVPDVAIEAWAFGRVPLAISARCYHARLYGRSKDSCQFACENDLDGLDVETLDGAPFLAINGVQTLSHANCNLIVEARTLASRGVSALRLSPQTCDMVAVAETFRRVLDGACEAPIAMLRLREIHPAATYANGFLHGTSGAHYV